MKYLYFESIDFILPLLYIRLGIDCGPSIFSVGTSTQYVFVVDCYKINVLFSILKNKRTQKKNITMFIVAYCLNIILPSTDLHGQRDPSLLCLAFHVQVYIKKAKNIINSSFSIFKLKLLNILWKYSRVFLSINSILILMFIPAK